MNKLRLPSSSFQLVFQRNDICICFCTIKLHPGTVKHPLTWSSSGYLSCCDGQQNVSSGGLGKMKNDANQFWSNPFTVFVIVSGFPKQIFHAVIIILPVNNLPELATTQEESFIGWLKNSVTKQTDTAIIIVWIRTMHHITSFVSYMRRYKISAPPRVTTVRRWMLYAKGMISEVNLFGGLRLQRTHFKDRNLVVWCLWPCAEKGGR